MKIFTTVVLSLVASVAYVTGLPAFTPDTKCTEPLWTVVGNHYVPREICSVTEPDVTRENAFREKYFEVLSVGGMNKDTEKINEVLDSMIGLFPFYAKYSTLTTLECSACETGMNVYHMLRKFHVKNETILNLLNELCVDLHIMTPNICRGALDLYGGALMEVVDRSTAKPDHICSVLLNKKCGSGIPDFNWNVTLPNTKKPPVVKPTPPPTSSRRLKVLHISDTHWDTQYKVGSWAECKLPLCCRAENVLPNNKATKAGKYGGWRCDTPEETFDSVLEHIAKQHPDIDYIVWTGDIPAHDIWEQSRIENLDVLKKTVAKFSKAFPKTPMFPALGNHESVPGNLFPTSKDNMTNPMDWLYDEVTQQWSRWLPQSNRETLRLGAFYTTLIRPGLRLVSMNMNYCYKMNWWLINDDMDPLNELKWFAEILQKAEDKREKVHVIGHIPPGSTDCLQAWQRNYYRIINRYEGTVTAQFFGHTHSDEFEVYYDLTNTSRPFGVGYIGPSVTTYMYHNPAYRVYYVEGDGKNSQRFVLDHETWYLDLEKANREEKAEWKKLYSAKDAYQMNGLYPDDWNKLYNQIKTSNRVLQLYHKYFWNDSPKRPVCGASCRKSRLCGIRSCDLYGQP